MATSGIAATLAILVAVAGTLAGCATAKPAPPLAAAAKPVSLAPAPSPPAQPDNDDWNIFPDPVTGEVAVYHHGQYVGVITGNEPGDPPMPHKSDKTD